MTVLTRLTPVTPGAISDPGIQNANRPLTISEIDSNFSDLYNFTLGKLAKTTDTFTGTLSIAGQLRFNGSVSGYVGFQSASTTANVLYTLPTSDGLNGQVLSTNGTGSLSWINQSAGGGGGGSGSGTSTSRTAFTATAGQTTFSVTYVVGQIDVYMNGSKLIVGTEVTASNGTTIVLAEAAGAGDIVEVVVYSTQWISSGSNLYYDQGNVGFGVTNPAARIHVGSAATALAVGTLRIDGADGAGTVNAPVTLNSVTDGATASGGSQFYIETRVPGGTLTEKFRIDGDGNVGINNNNPQSALDVTGNVRISGSTTLSGGTANGVLYLNGSKVATSGSALTFDGTSLGVGTASPQTKLHVAGTGTTAISVERTSAAIGGRFEFISGDSTNLINTTIAKPINFGQASATVMTLDTSGYLGLGVTAPLVPLDIRATQGTLNLSAGSDPIVNLNILNPDTTAGTGPTIAFSSYYSSTNAGPLATIAVERAIGSGASASALSNNIIFRQAQTATTALTERMRIDSSGNVGIGTSSPSGILHTSSANGVTILESPGVSSVGLRFRTNSVDRWQIQVPSGSSDLAVYTGAAATERLRIDSSGNLGLGVTPSAWGGVWKVVESGRTGNAFVTRTGGGRAILTSNTIFGASSDTYANTGAAAYFDIDANSFKFFTAPSGTAGNTISFTQAMTLTADPFLTLNGAAGDGRLQISNTARAVIDGFWIGVDSTQSYLLSRGAYPLVFSTNSNERARITSGGDLLVGTTQVSTNNLNGTAVRLFSGGSYLEIAHNNTATTGQDYEAYRYNGTQIGGVSQNGTTGVLFNTTSDRRLKDNIVPAPSASNVIDAIQIVSHDWKAAPDEHVTYGVIAQDLALVAPHAVLQGDDGDEIEKAWGVDYSKLVPMLIKEIQSLRARVAVLEAQP